MRYIQLSNPNAVDYSMNFDHDSKALKSNQYQPDRNKYGQGSSPSQKNKMGALMRPNEITPIGQLQSSQTPEKKASLKQIAAGVRTNFGNQQNQIEQMRAKSIDPSATLERAGNRH